MGNKESALIYIIEGSKLVGLEVQQPTATHPAPTPTELELVRIFKEHKKMKATIDDIAYLTLHLLWLIDSVEELQSENYPELKGYLDVDPHILKKNIGEIQKHCAEAGSKIAQTGKIE